MKVQLLSTAGLGVLVGSCWLVACGSSDAGSPLESGGAGASAHAGAGGSAANQGGSFASGGAGASAGGATSVGGEQSGGTGGSAAGVGGNAGSSASAGSSGAATSAGNGGAAGAAGNNGKGGASGDGGAVGSAGAAGTGAAAGNGGSAGASVGGAAGTGGGSAGSSGAGGAGASGCGGCAVLTAPFTAANQQMTAQIGLNPTDLTNVTLTVRACVAVGDASDALHVYMQNGAAQNYAGDYGVLFKTLDTVKKCADGMQDLTLAIASTGMFDASVVTALNVQVVTATATGPFSAATVYIDSITATGDAIGPWGFTSNASALGLAGGGVDGATITWLP